MNYFEVADYLLAGYLLVGGKQTKQFWERNQLLSRTYVQSALQTL